MPLILTGTVVTADRESPVIDPGASQSGSVL